MRLAVRTLVERASRWMVNNRRHPLDSEATVEYFGTDIQKVVRDLPELLLGTEAEAFKARMDHLAAAGVASDLAADIAVLPMAYAALEIVEIAKRDGVDPIEVARVHMALGEHLGLTEVFDRIAALPRTDRWQTMARATLRDDLYAVHAELTSQVLGGTGSAQPASERVAAWHSGEETAVDRACATLREITGDEDADLARLSVGLRVVRGLIAS
jgi:glutamate dehydrogenase